MKIDTSLGVLALVMHAALMELASPNGNNRGNSVGRFRCTDIPLDNIIAKLSLTSQAEGIKPTKEGGFAPPIFELPNGQLLPNKWESYVQHILVVSPVTMVVF